MLQEEGAPFQLINYELIMSPSPVSIHQLISGKLIQLILNFIDNTNNGGAAFTAPMDVKFNEGNIFQPDILYIAANRKNEILKERIEGAPDLIIEILSPSNAYYDLREKKNIYEKYGVREYIIIDPHQQDAELYILKEGLFYLHQQAKKQGKLNSLVLPGLSFDLIKIFTF